MLCFLASTITIIQTVRASPGIITVPGMYPTISAAIAAASPGDTILVDPNTYSETLQISKTLTISASSGTVIVKGGGMFTTHYGNRQAVIFVTGASNVVLTGLDVEGQGLGVPGGTKSYAVLYESSSGTVQGCTLSPNTIGDMYSTAIAAWDNSDLTIKGCTVNNFGRIGIYSNNATVNITGNTIIGQPYVGSGQVNYGIEIEDYTGYSVAAITNNEIYNCGDSNPSPSWSSCAIIVDTWRYYKQGSLQPSAVSIKYNNIHDNWEAIEVVANSQIYAHCNNIRDNLYGVWPDADEKGNYATLDAINNWWGSAAGPSGNDVDTDHVTFSPWLSEAYAPTKSVATATGTGIASFTPDVGCIVGLTAVPEPTSPRPAATFPHGLFSFSIVCLTPGETVTLTVTLPSTVPAGTQWWKYDPSTHAWYTLPTSINGNTVTFALTDGGTGDLDKTVNSVIVDPGGPGFPEPVGGEWAPIALTAVPTDTLLLLTPWIAMASLAIAFGAAVFHRLIKKRL